MNGIEKIFQRYQEVVDNAFILKSGLRYKCYAVSTLRGGVGKSTLAFNLAFEIAKKTSILLADLCPQCNFTETMMRGEKPGVTVFDALQPKILGPAFGEPPDDVAYRVSNSCNAFKGKNSCYLVPGDAQLFSLPPSLYQQLQISASRPAPGRATATKKLLESLMELLKEEAKDKKCLVTLVDTSPFYAGGTHLAWCAAEALILPVRVDEHSLESLDLTLRMLSSPKSDFTMWNNHAGTRPIPKIAAIVMTMVGPKSRIKSTPDSASKMFIERALRTAEQYPNLFDYADPADAFAVTDDFVSTGRVSGAKSIPISDLQVGSFHTVEGKRLQVNLSATRYQRQLAYLASLI